MTTTPHPAAAGSESHIKGKRRSFSALFSAARGRNRAESIVCLRRMRLRDETVTPGSGAAARRLVTLNIISLCKAASCCQQEGRLTVNWKCLTHIFHTGILTPMTVCSFVKFIGVCFFSPKVPINSPEVRKVCPLVSFACLHFAEFVSLTQTTLEINSLYDNSPSRVSAVPPVFGPPLVGS